MCSATSAQLGAAERWRTMPASADLTAVKEALAVLFHHISKLEARSHLCTGRLCVYKTWLAYSAAKEPEKCKFLLLGCCHSLACPSFTQAW